MKIPIVALCGRPNVGKSTLFNRLTRTRAALVHDLPGMTRDRNYGLVTCLAENDSIEELFKLIDTGGISPSSGDQITEGINQSTKAAIQEADVLILMVDAHDGWNPVDAEIACNMRLTGKPIILIINKIDGVKGATPDSTFYQLGFHTVHIISAQHGLGIAEMLISIRQCLPFHCHGDSPSLPSNADEIRFAIIGRPNVGKSSVTNKLLGYERSLVSDVAGTTRDTVDTVFNCNNKLYRIIDTAGIRKKGKTYLGAEKLSILKAKQAMARADVSLLLIDATEGVTHQDSVIAGYAQEAGAAVILLVNKWDLLDKDTFTAIDFEQKVRHDLGFLSSAPIYFISALTGQRINKIISAIDVIAHAHAQRITTGQLNQFLQKTLKRMAPPPVDGKEIKLYFMTQVGTRPPSFVIKTNTDKSPHFSYQRFLENQLRQTFGFIGTPIRLAFANRNNDRTSPHRVARVRKILDPGVGLKPSRIKNQTKRYKH